VTPDAGKGATFQENSGADAWSVVNGKPLDIEDHSLWQVGGWVFDIVTLVEFMGHIQVFP